MYSCLLIPMKLNNDDCANCNMKIGIYKVEMVIIMKWWALLFMIRLNDSYFRFKEQLLSLKLNQLNKHVAIDTYQYIIDFSLNLILYSLSLWWRKNKASTNILMIFMEFLQNIQKLINYIMFHVISVEIMLICTVVSQE